MTVCFVTLGCKVNQYDSQAMLELFKQHGYIPVQPETVADIYVINTCTVTGTGDQKSLKLVRRFRRENPTAEIIITGCLAQRMGEALRETGARLILGTQYRARVVELFEQALEKKMQMVAVQTLESAPYEALFIGSHQGRTRAVMKIQEGCNNHCTYCIIPSVRGGIRSRSLTDIRQEAQALSNAGYQEIVLTGIHLTSYGRDLADAPSLADAIRMVAQPPGIKRIRLGSLEPSVANDAFISALQAIPQVCPQFHLALQSGSDAVLRRMKRQYSTAQYSAAVNRLYNAYPNAAITTDIIVGFPGETDEEFEETMTFCAQTGFAKIHVFPFSRREGTPAATMAMQVPEAVKKQRVQRLMNFGTKLANDYAGHQLGTIQEVLLEERLEDGMLTGYSPEYTIVKVSCDNTPGQIVSVRITGSERDGLRGDLVNQA